MTDHIGTTQLAWEMGLKKTHLLGFIYNTLPKEEWPGKGGRWLFTPDQVREIKALHQNIPEKSRVRLTLRDGDEMYDLCEELEHDGKAILGPDEDVAAIMRELIYDHEIPVSLHTRDHRATVLRLNRG